MKILNDPLFIIEESGRIFTRKYKTGKLMPDGKWREVFPSRDKYGYLYIRYFRKHIFVHRLVFAKFKGPLIEDLQINHIDGNPANNTIGNLEQVTGSENMLHSFRELGRDAVIGNFKIDHGIAQQIREDRKKGLKYRELQTKYGLAKSTISCIINLKTWK